MNIDHGNQTGMEQISISKFKATCFDVLERERQTREPVLVTRRGVPVAEIKPPPLLQAVTWLGTMVGTLDIIGDCCTRRAGGPWEALR